MAKPNGGGSAYPHPYDATDHPGMELRDWFAGMALVGLLHPQTLAAQPNKDTASRDLATMAYNLADAILAKRNEAQ